MSSCIAAREVVIKLRERKTGNDITTSVICPGRWEKGRLLEYVRREHPESTVKIMEWKTVCEDGPWRVRLWLVNPKEMVQ